MIYERGLGVVYGWGLGVGGWGWGPYAKGSGICFGGT